jgi:hypothetical protein
MIVLINWNINTLYGIKASCCALCLYFNIHVQHWKLLLALPLYYTYVTDRINSYDSWGMRFSIWKT